MVEPLQNSGQKSPKDQEARTAYWQLPKIEPRTGKGNPKNHLRQKPRPIKAAICFVDANSGAITDQAALGV